MIPPNCVPFDNDLGYLTPDEVELYQQMHDDLVAGVFYKKQEDAMKEMFGPDAKINYV